MILSLMLGWRFPKLFGFTDHDVKRLYPSMEKMLVEPVKETGYMHIQATKPDTAGERTSYKMRVARWSQDVSSQITICVPVIQGGH